MSPEIVRVADPSRHHARFGVAREVLVRVGQYDTTLQMFVEAPHRAEYRHLLFYRWLAEQYRLEHPVAGPPILRDDIHEQANRSDLLIPAYSGKQ